MQTMLEQLRPQISNDPGAFPSAGRRIEAYEGACRELFAVRNPGWYKKTGADAEAARAEFFRTVRIPDAWIYFPWAKTVVHTVAEDDYLELRTGRNRNIISKEEQSNLREMRVGIVGLSIGSIILSTLVRIGGPKAIKLADFDTIEITNLNRMDADLLSYGDRKIAVAAKRAWAVDPFADLKLWEDGVADETLETFIIGDPALQVFIDEMDSLNYKVKARMICRRHRIPVLMATNIGDRVMIDIERFDEEPDRPLFHGRMDIDPESVASLPYAAWVREAKRIVGEEFLTDPLKATLGELGKTVSAIPQLGSTTAVGGAGVGYALRRIANGQEMPSGRYIISVDEPFLHSLI